MLPVLPCVVHLHRVDKKLYQGCDIYIGRKWERNGWKLERSKWYDESIEGSALLEAYEKHVRNSPELMNGLDELSGKLLGCWCHASVTGEKSTKLCHGEVLIRLWKEKFPKFTEDPNLWFTKYYPQGQVDVVEKKKRATKRKTEGENPPAKKVKLSRKVMRNQTTHPEGIKHAGTLHAWPALNHEWNPETIWIDEAGMGCLAGPLHVAGTYLLPGFDVQGLHDSKLLREDERKDIFTKLTTSGCIIYHIEKMTNQEIDQMKLGGAWKEAIRRIVTKLKQKVETAHPDVKITRVILDGNKTVANTAVEITPVTSADRLYAGVSAASILAKVSRDEYMREVAKDYPDFYEIFHNGHGYRHSVKHDELIKSGIYTVLHRKSFGLLRDKLSKPHIQIMKAPDSPVKVLTLNPEESLVPVH